MKFVQTINDYKGQVISTIILYYIEFTFMSDNLSNNKSLGIYQ